MELNNRKSIEEWAKENKINLRFISNFDDAIIGLANDGLQNPRVIYSKDKIFEILSHQNLSISDIAEFYDYNIACNLSLECDPIIME